MEAKNVLSWDVPMRAILICKYSPVKVSVVAIVYVMSEDESRFREKKVIQSNTYYSKRYSPSLHMRQMSHNGPPDDKVTF